MSIEARIRMSRGEFSLDVDLRLPGQGITALFGRSGSGKTTLLRCLAGLERVPGMELTVDGEVWQDSHRCVPVHQRSLGFVFQEASLFPHLTVQRNLLYGHKRVAAGGRRVAFDETVQLLGLESLLRRYPEQLSGGQRQRVAIGRALLTSPRLLLMDEPMASLDQASKAEIIPYLERLHSTLSIPIIYVTHSIEEVSRLADSMVLLEQGRALAQGSLQDLLTRPDLPLAHSANAAAVLDAVVIDRSDDQMSELQLSGGLTLLSSGEGVAPGERVRARILARDVAIALEPPRFSSVSNCLPATLCGISDDPHPGHVLLSLDLAGQRLLSRITRRSLERLKLQQGQQVQALVKAVTLVGWSGSVNPRSPAPTPADQ